MAKEKVKKKKGPVRVEAIIPALVVFALVYGYFFFFFDGHLRRGAEYLLTQVHGAEVNIGDIQTSFLNASLEVKKIQVTDKNQPERDLFRVGGVKFKMLWDALLRAKVVVDEASITEIQALVPRDKPGRVLPPPPPDKPGVLAQAEREIMDQTRSKFQDNILGDIASVVDGVDVKDQLNSIKGDLKASLRTKELEAELKKKKEEWDQRLKNLPESSYFKELETRFKAIDWNEKDPLKFAKNIQTANDLIKEAKSKVKEIDKAQSDLRGDLKTYGGAVKELEKFVEQDLKDLQSRLKIPSIDPKNFTQAFFMKQIEQKLVSARKYYEVAKKYMPPKKTEEEKRQRAEEALVPRARGEGQNFSFPITKGYPKFWLKKALITSTVSSSSEYSGNIKGEILDVTSHPRYLKRPTRINVAGDFPKQKIAGLDMKAIVDHTTDQPKQSVDLKLAAFPVGQLKLSESPDAKLAINDSVGALQMKAALSDGSVLMEIQSQYNQLAYAIEAKQKIVKEVLDAIFKGIPQITLNAKVRGPWTALRFNLNSNLGEALAKGFGQQLKIRIEEAKAKIRQQIENQISDQKAQLKNQLNAFTGDLEKRLGVKKQEVDKVIKDLEAGVKKEEGGLVKKGELKKLEDKGKKLLKGLGL